jgi:general secretion pathway protein J
MNRRRCKDRASGFTLVEALVATALMALVLAALASITAKWLPNWNRGFARVQQNGNLDIGLERIVSDLAAAEFVPPNARNMHPLFVGVTSSVIFVRSGVDPNANPGLEIVRIAESVDARGPILTRSRAPFVPVPPQASGAPPDAFSDPVVLARFPYQVSFSYAGRDRVWKDAWIDAALLPSAIRISVRDATTRRLLPVSTAVSLHVNASMRCATADGSDDCAGASPAAARPGDAKAGTSASPNDDLQQSQ